MGAGHGKLTMTFSGNDLFLVSIHELGHALGLAHSTNPSSVMFATYQHHNTRHFKMPLDDIMDGVHTKCTTHLNSYASSGTICARALENLNCTTKRVMMLTSKVKQKKI